MLLEAVDLNMLRTFLAVRVSGFFFFSRKILLGIFLPLRCEIWQASAFSDGLLKTGSIRNQSRLQGKHLEPAKSPYGGCL